MEGIYKYAIGLCSGGKKNMANFVKIALGIQKLLQGDTHTSTQTAI
jgi:hypothetical protein